MWAVRAHPAFLNPSRQLVLRPRPRPVPRPRLRGLRSSMRARSDQQRQPGSYQGPPQPASWTCRDRRPRAAINGVITASRSRGGPGSGSVTFALASTNRRDAAGVKRARRRRRTLDEPVVNKLLEEVAGGLLPGVSGPTRGCGYSGPAGSRQPTVPMDPSACATVRTRTRAAFEDPLEGLPATIGEDRPPEVTVQYEAGRDADQTPDRIRRVGLPHRGPLRHGCTSWSPTTPNRPRTRSRNT